MLVQQHVSDVVGYFNSCNRKSTVKFAGERVLKIGHHLAKLDAKIQWNLSFPDTVYKAVPVPSIYLCAANLILLVRVRGASAAGGTWFPAASLTERVSV